MQPRRTSRHAETLFKKLERDTQNPVEMYRCLIRRAAAQLNLRAAETAALRAEVKMLRTRSLEQDKELHELRLRLAQLAQQQKKKNKQQQQQECRITHSADATVGRAVSTSAKLNTPTSTPTHRNYLCYASAYQQQEQDQHVRVSLAVERILCEVLLVVMSDHPDPAEPAGSLDEPQGPGEPCLGRAVMSSVRLLKVREASLRSRIAELEAALRLYENTRIGACAAAEHNAEDALATILPGRARAHTLTPNQCPSPEEVNCVKGSSVTCFQEDLCGEQELMEYAAWKHDLEELISSE